MLRENCPISRHSAELKTLENLIKHHRRFPTHDDAHVWHFLPFRSFSLNQHRAELIKTAFNPLHALISNGR